MVINYTPIGIIKTPFKKKEGMPIQPTGAPGVKGEIEIYDEFKDGLKDLDGFSHIILIYHLHQSVGFQLNVKPFMDDQLRGVFSTRAPKRPNPIGLSVVKLTKIENNILHIENIDVLDGTPLIDIKPFIPDVDSPKADRLGWLDGKSNKMGDKLSDNRF
ncbi:MAG TPA: tRNA (N6-threonylcarbamoyladenosine(37)-N6)-methyltransferase TrmO [Bacteroidales bacterium]|nr:tRNA (N6-threonylcarbamoyladenosine(37)-N6)-methyltransferase TrmO [Bacteroidales bacterium]